MIVFTSHGSAKVDADLSEMLLSQLDIRIAGEVGCAEAVDKAMLLKPDVILIDLFEAGAAGMETMEAVKVKLPAAKVVVVSVSEDVSDLFRALRLGAHGYLPKSAPPAQIVEAIREAVAGRTTLSPLMADKLVAEFRRKILSPKLSAREIQVWQLLRDGLDNAEIARALLVGESTVRTYVRRLMEKLQLDSRTEVIQLACGESPESVDAADAPVVTRWTDHRLPAVR